MSFYLNIRSTDSLDIFPNNYGGDFQVELSTPLHFDENDPWEVALVEMMYEAQPFPNIPAEYSHFTIEHLNKDKFFNAKDLDFSISAIIRVTTYGKWWDSNSELLPEYRRFPKYVLPRKNYTWEGFKAEINKLAKPNESKYFSYSIKITDTHIEINYRSSVKFAQFIFSPDLVKFLKLKQDTIETPYNKVELSHGDVKISYTTPRIPPGHIIFPANSLHSIWIEIKAHTRFTIPHENYTIEDLAANFTTLTTHGAFKNVMRLTFEYTETSKHFNWELKIETFGALKITLHFSYGFLFYLNTHADNGWTHIDTDKAMPPTTIRHGTIQKNNAEVDEAPLIHGSFPFNYYPTAQSFCDGISGAIMNIADQFADAQPHNYPLFTMEKLSVDGVLGSTSTGKCVFTPHPHIKITLDPFILKLLKLDNTLTKNTDTSVVVMPSATRDFFYLYTNIIASHTYSGAVNLLRIINNSTSLANEKVMVSFQHLYYHPLTQINIGNIQIRITDNHTDLLLPFENPVSCLLHFRRCSNSHSL